MEETPAETSGFPAEGAAAQDPSLYAAPDVYAAERHPAPAYEGQPEAKKPKRDPIWHQFTLPDMKDGGISKKRICKEPNCACTIHHGCAQAGAARPPAPFQFQGPICAPSCVRVASPVDPRSPASFQAEPVGGAHPRRHPRREEDDQEVRVARHRGHHGG